MTTSAETLGTAGAMRNVEGGFIGLPQMDAPGTDTGIADSFSNPEGTVTSTGFFELKKSQPVV